MVQKYDEVCGDVPRGRGKFLEAGINLVIDAKSRGVDLIATGDMGNRQHNTQHGGICCLKRDQKPKILPVVARGWTTLPSLIKSP